MRTHISFAVLSVLLFGCVSPSPPDEGGELPVQVEHKKDNSIAMSAVVKTLDPKGVLSFGDEKAKNTLTIFTEYHCKYCMEFHREYFAEVQNTFIETGDVRVQFVPFLIHKYPNSTNINKGLLCALQMNKGNEMHIALSLGQEERRITAEDHAAELELDAEVFTECMQSEEMNAVLDHQQEVAKQLEIERVPTFILNEEKITGLPSKADMMGWIRETIE